MLDRIKDYLKQPCPLYNINSSIVVFFVFIGSWLVYISIMIIVLVTTNSAINNAVQDITAILEARIHTQYVYTLLQDQIASNQIDKRKLKDGTLLFESYITKTYQNLKYISTRKSVVTGSISEKILNVHIFDLYNRNVCKYYLQEFKQYNCDFELLNTGLETLSIQIVEKSKALLSKFELTLKDKLAARDLINSEEYKTICKFK